MRLLRARQTTAQVTACINSLRPRYRSICYRPEPWISFKTRKKTFRLLWKKGHLEFSTEGSSLVQIFKPIRPGARRPVMALTCPCAMTSSDSMQSQGRAVEFHQTVPFGPWCRAPIPTHVGSAIGTRERTWLSTHVTSPLKWQVAVFVIGADQWAICHSSPSAKSPPPPPLLMLGTLWLLRKKKSPPLH